MPEPCNRDRTNRLALRFRREPEPRQRRDHHVEGILWRSAGLCRVGERADGVQELNHGSRPAMREDDRKGPGATAAHMIEMNIEVIHPRLELRESVQPGLS